MRSLGARPTETELHQMIQEIDSAGTGRINFEQFIKVLTRKLREPFSEEEMKEAFKLFDKDGSNVISAAELRRVLTSMGEKLNQEEVDEMMREGGVEGGAQITYEQFLKMMMGK